MRAWPLRDKLLRKDPSQFSEVLVTGVTGTPTALQIARVKEIRIGPITLQDVPIAFADVPPFAVFGLASKPSLLLGTDLMESFRKVSLDFSKRKVRFQLKKCPATGLILRTSSGHATRLSTAMPAACAR